LSPDFDCSCSLRAQTAAIVPCIHHRTLGTSIGKTSLVKASPAPTPIAKGRKAASRRSASRLALPDGARAGVVDVPGHERFIKNMLAGAHGIDLVLFTVAADDGVMPQTEEHLDIVHLLGVRRGVFVITKADLVGPARLADVADEIRILIASTALKSPIVPFALDPRRLDEIRTAIIRTLHDADKPAPRGRFRLPVDRAFLSPGHGLIVTGTATGGACKVPKVRCLPSGRCCVAASKCGGRCRAAHGDNASR
jgi:selenocysteine-specific elongation factor